MARIAIIALLLLATAPALAEPAQPDAPPPPAHRAAGGCRCAAATRGCCAGGAERGRTAGGHTLRHRTRTCANPCA